MARSTTPREPRGNYVSEWFGHRIYPQVITSASSLADQTREKCPFLSEVTDEFRECIKSPAAKGVCTISTATAATRRDWLVCPYRAFDPGLINNAVCRLFDFPASQPATIVPAIRLTHPDARQSLVESLDAGGRGFIYFDAKLGGELTIPATAQSPEFSFDVTVIEVELNEGEPHIGRFGVIEIQTMDFHGSYRHVVQNLKDGLRLHPNNFPQTVQANQNWLSEHIEGPNIANVFKRTFYQMMFKFQLAQNPRCAGCVLAVPMSVWDSWQRHLGEPALTAEADGTYSLFEPGRARPANVPAWIYAFDLDATSPHTPSPVLIPKIIATDADAMSHYTLTVAPAAALENIGAPTGMLAQLSRRLRTIWPELARTIKV
jgi:hypothetical protein